MKFIFHAVVVMVVSRIPTCKQRLWARRGRANAKAILSWAECHGPAITNSRGGCSGPYRVRCRDMLLE